MTVSLKRLAAASTTATTAAQVRHADGSFATAIVALTDSTFPAAARTVAANHAALFSGATAGIARNLCGQFNHFLLV